jgi:glycosyl transferase family 87
VLRRVFKPDAPSNSPLRWHGAVATGFALLFLIIGLWSFVGIFLTPTGIDFISFWSAGKLVLQGHPALAYDIHVHRLMEQSIIPKVGLIPFPYPPPFLAIITPFAVPTFQIGFILWVAVTVAFYAFAASRVARLNYAFGNSPTCIGWMIGQSNFLTCGVFMLGVSLLSVSPFTAGAVLGLMLLKPQLALLLPVAMLAGREWRVIAGAIFSAAIVLIIGLVLFGWTAYEAFWTILPHYVEFVRDARLPWYELASPFEVARSARIPQVPAFVIHIVIATTATALTARAWWLKLDERIPVLAASTMLISPYFFTYDCLLIVIPIGWLVKQNRRPTLVAFVLACSLIPVITSFSPWAVPNTMPFAAIACLYGLHSEPKRTRREKRTTVGALSPNSTCG